MFRAFRLLPVTLTIAVTAAVAAFRLTMPSSTHAPDGFALFDSTAHPHRCWGALVMMPGLEHRRPGAHAHHRALCAWCPVGHQAGLGRRPVPAYRHTATIWSGDGDASPKHAMTMNRVVYATVKGTDVAPSHTDTAYDQWMREGVRVRKSAPQDTVYGQQIWQLTGCVTGSRFMPDTDCRLPGF